MHPPAYTCIENAVSRDGIVVTKDGIQLLGEASVVWRRVASARTVVYKRTPSSEKYMIKFLCR